jgi:integrase
LVPIFGQMKKKTWPPVKKVEKNGRDMFMVDCRINGKGERHYFDTKKEADTDAEAQRIKRTNEGNAAVRNDELAAFGKSVQWAIDFALKHLRATKASASMTDAVAAFIEHKTRELAAGEIGATRLADIRNRLARVAAAFEAKTIGEIEADELAAFLQSIPHPATRNDYRKEIVTLWRWAALKPRQWTSVALHKDTLKRAKEPDKARKILTVEQAARLMEASTDGDICALNAMVLFGGLRREEVEALDWSAVNFAEGYIEVSDEVSKVDSERFAPMPDNLREWLMPVAQKRGPIIARNLMHPLRRTWKAAGIYPWTQDAHRHSFISYRRQLTSDGQTAREAGTSEKIIKRHYKRPVTTANAERYFAISPSTSASGKVVAIG